MSLDSRERSGRSDRDAQSVRERKGAVGCCRVWAHGPMLRDCFTSDMLKSSSTRPDHGFRGQYCCCAPADRPVGMISCADTLLGLNERRLDSFYIVVNG